jgi:hypothetical protein
MHKYALAFLVVTIPLLPTTVRACGDCGCEDAPVVVHFKDGLTPNGPVTGDAGQAVSIEGGCPCAEAFGFRDYGPPRVVPPPAPMDTKQMVKRPSS